MSDAAVKAVADAAVEAVKSSDAAEAITAEKAVDDEPQPAVIDKPMSTEALINKPGDEQKQTPALHSSNKKIKHKKQQKRRQKRQQPQRKSTPQHQTTAVKESGSNATIVDSDRREQSTPAFYEEVEFDWQVVGADKRGKNASAKPMEAACQKERRLEQAPVVADAAPTLDVASQERPQSIDLTATPQRHLLPTPGAPVMPVPLQQEQHSQAPVDRCQHAAMAMALINSTRRYTNGMRSDDFLLRRFVATCVHPSTPQSMGGMPDDVEHRCWQHRDRHIAPPVLQWRQSDDLTLHEIFVAQCDSLLQCAVCAQSGRNFSGARRWTVGGCCGSTGDLLSVEYARQQVRLFVASLYARLSGTVGGSAFRACAVCKREFDDDHYHIEIVLRGVDERGSVHFGVLLRCARSHDSMRCDALTEWLEQCENRLPGIVCTSRAYTNLGGDTVVRVHAAARGNCISTQQDLLFHLPNLPLRRLVLRHDAKVGHATLQFE